MNRTDILGLESSCTRRSWSGQPLEFRATANGDTLTFEGYASVTDTPYDVYGGAPYGWTETIARGAFKKTLKEGADIAFLINHEGMTLARTKSGTLRVNEDAKGEHVLADLDARMGPVRDLSIAGERGDVDEMSIGFRVVRDAWFDERGEPSNNMEGTRREIREINQDKGDVSAVNYGASPTTSGGFRSVDIALAELRAGKKLDDEQRDLIRSLALSLDDDPEDEQPDEVVERSLSETLARKRSLHELLLTA